MEFLYVYGPLLIVAFVLLAIAAAWLAWQRASR